MTASQVLSASLPIVDARGVPTPQFQRLWQDLGGVAQSGGVPPGYYVRTGLQTGWSSPTGTASKSAFATYAAPTAAGSYSQAQMQAVMDHMQVLSQHLKAVIDGVKASNLFAA
jgi:hypothetical protein